MSSEPLLLPEFSILYLLRSEVNPPAFLENMIRDLMTITHLFSSRIYPSLVFAVHVMGFFAAIKHTKGQILTSV